MAKELVEIYSTTEDSFTVGFILYENYERLFTQLVDDQGKLDGYLLLDKQMIAAIESGSEYLNKIQKYMQFRGNISIGSSDNPIYKSEPDFIDLIRYANEHKKIITVATSFQYHDQATGFIKSFDEESFVIEAIDNSNAKIFEEFVINIDDLILLEIETIDNFLLGYANKQS